MTRQQVPADRHSILGPSQQVGLVVASGVVPTTFTGSLSQRSWLDQGLITGLATSSHFLLTVVSQGLVNTAGTALSTVLPLPAAWTDEQRQSTATLLVDLAAIPVGFGAAALVTEAEDERALRSALRQSCWRLGLTGMAAAALAVASAASSSLDRRLGLGGRLTRLPVAIPVGLALDLVIERLRQRDTPPDHDTDPARANPLLGLAAGAGVVLLLAGAASGETLLARQLGSVGRRVLPGSETLWRRIGHGIALGGTGYATSQLWKTAMVRIEAGTSGYDEGVDDTAPGVWTHPLVSGDPASLVAWPTLGREGRRHVVTFVRPAPLVDAPVAVNDIPRPELSIQTVMGEPARATPIQVYVGLDSAPTASERVELALAEMDRTQAWSRSLIMLVSPTGTGYVNYVASAAVQYMTRGDVATVTLQYSKRPSPLSLGKIGPAKEQNRLLWLRILQRVRAMPPDQRPRVVLFGESLGALTSQAAFQGWGTLGPEALGIDRALWIGTPASSAWRQEITGPDRPDVDPDLVAVVNDYEQYAALPGKDGRRFVLLSHDNDGVTRFDAALLARRPGWLGDKRPHHEALPDRSPRGIPTAMRWRPVTTFFQLLVDMKNAQLPGSYRAWGHDYRADLPEFIRDVYQLDVTDDQLTRVKDACRAREEFREQIFT